MNEQLLKSSNPPVQHLNYRLKFKPNELEIRTFWYTNSKLMSESGDLDGEQSNKISRRDILKMGATGGAALATSAFLKKEYSKFKEGVVTPVGTFIPLYERHDLGIKVSDIPSDLNGFFRELASPYLMEIPPRDLLETEAIALDTGQRKQRTFLVFPDQILQKLSQQGTEIIIGDIFTEEDGSPSNFEFTIKAEAILGSLAIAASSLTHLSELGHKKVTRRDILQKGLIGFSLWGNSLFLSGGLSIVGQTQEGAIKRIVARLYGISSDFHPELPLLFLRNVIMADKLLTVAEQMKSQTDKNPKIAFQVEGDHSGIEDFLVAGRDVCHFLVLSYPNSVLRPIVEYNNGIEDFCSARLFKLSKDTSPNTSDPPNLENISERCIIDTKLQQSLEKKFQA